MCRTDVRMKMSKLVEIVAQKSTERGGNRWKSSISMNDPAGRHNDRKGGPVDDAKVSSSKMREDGEKNKLFIPGN